MERIVSKTNERNGKGLWQKGRGKELRLERDTERKKGIVGRIKAREMNA
jgi:hypothetical protein